MKIHTRPNNINSSGKVVLMLCRVCRYFAMYMLHILVLAPGSQIGKCSKKLVADIIELSHT